MWVVNADRDVLINLDTGLRIAIMPTNKQKDSEDQLYGIIVQTPADATLPLGRPMPTGFSNTVLISGVLLDDCQALLDQIVTKLDAWRIPHTPFEIDMPETVILRYTDHLKTTWEYICEDEITAMRMLYGYVADHWFKHLEMPEDEDKAIELYYQTAAGTESWSVKPTPYIAWKDLRGKRR